MKLHAEISGQKHEIEIERESGRVTATVDGRSYEVEISEPEPGVVLIKNNGRIFEAIVSQPANFNEPRQVRVGGGEFEIELIDPKRLRGTGNADAHDHGLADIKSAMPGKVVRILAPAGTEVEKGQGILVVEAMKMQNELRSPKSGVVKAIRVEEGSTVGAGDVLATIA